MSEWSSDGMNSDGANGDGKNEGPGDPVSDLPGERPDEHRGERPGEHRGDGPGEPAAGRRSDWRTDGSAGRFIDAPSRPSSPPANTSPARSGATSPASPAQASARDQAGNRSGDRRGAQSSERPGGPSGGRQGGSSGGRQDKRSGDPVADMQRWMMKAGARSMANQVADNVRRTLGQPKRASGDVWGTATTEPPPEESPECQWCPVCQAARRIRLSGPGIGDRLVNAGGVFASVMQDAFSVVEQAMRTPPQEDRPQEDRPRGNGPRENRPREDGEQDKAS